MSNAKKPQNKPNSLERYRSEVKGEPFVLWVTDEKKIEIPRPTGDQMFDAEEAFNTGTSKQVIEAFCGERAEEFLAVVGKEDAAVMSAIAQDMQEHFGLGN